MAEQNVDCNELKAKSPKRGSECSNKENRLVTFIVGSPDCKKRFKCHKKMLAKASEVFHAMFFGPLAEEQLEILVPDVDPEYFELVCQFIYRSKVTLTSIEQALRLLYASKKYILTDLKIQCFMYVCKRLTVGNVCNIYEIAEQFDEAELADHCLEVIIRWAEKILQHPTFLDIKHTTLVTILEQDNLQVPSELNVINACVRWAREKAHLTNLPNDTSGIRQALGSAFSLIRFLSLTPTEFVDGPMKSNLLTKEEEHCILVNKISLRGNNANLPPGISIQTERRVHYNGELVFYSTILRRCIKICLLSNNDSFPINSTVAYHFNPHYSEPNLKVFDFAVDKDISLIGFQVPTQSSVNYQGQLLYGSSYFEELQVQLSSNIHEVGLIYFTGIAHYDSKVQIIFPEPVKISKNIRHEVVFTFCCPGNYNTVNKEHRVKKATADGVEFRLWQIYSEGMVLSILFTCN